MSNERKYEIYEPGAAWSDVPPDHKYKHLIPGRRPIPQEVLKYPIAHEMFSIWMNDLYEVFVVTNLHSWKKKTSLALAHAVAVASKELNVSTDTMLREISTHLEELK